MAASHDTDATGRELPPGRWRLIEEVATVALFTVMFVTVIAGVAARYVIEQPLVWTVSVSTLAFIGVVMVGSGLLSRADDHIQFDVVYVNLPGHLQTASRLFTDLLIIVPFTAAIPATIRYLQFMHHEQVPGLGLRFSLGFGTFLLFLVVTVLHRLRRLITEVRDIIVARRATP